MQGKGGRCCRGNSLLLLNRKKGSKSQSGFAEKESELEVGKVWMVQQEQERKENEREPITYQQVEEMLNV